MGFLMPNSHGPPDTTRQSCLRRDRRCELSLETVWQCLNSQPIDHRRRVAFSGEVQVQSYAVVQSVFTFCVAYDVAACGRSGGQAQLPAWPASQRRSTGRRGGLVLPDVEVRLAAGQARSASECVRRSHCAARHTPTQTRHRTHCLAVGPTQFTPPNQTRQNTTVLFVSCLAWRCELALV